MIRFTGFIIQGKGRSCEMIGRCNSWILSPQIGESLYKIQKSGGFRVLHPSHEQDQPGFVVLDEEEERVIRPEDGDG